MSDNITNTLSQKIVELMEKYKYLVSENERLMNELTQAKAKCEAQAYEISKLEEELLNKNLIEEETLKSIEQLLGNN